MIFAVTLPPSDLGYFSFLLPNWCCVRFLWCCYDVQTAVLILVCALDREFTGLPEGGRWKISEAASAGGHGCTGRIKTQRVRHRNSLSASYVLRCCFNRRVWDGLSWISKKTKRAVCGQNLRVVCESNTRVSVCSPSGCHNSLISSLTPPSSSSPLYVPPLILHHSAACST